MSELVKERSAEALVEVDEESGETSQNDSSMLKIVSNIETRMIQEDIQKKREKHDEIKISWKSFRVSGLGFALMSLGMIGMASTMGNDDFGILEVGSAFAEVIGLVAFILGGLSALENVYDKRRNAKQQIEYSRIELAEKSLNIEVLKKDQTTITEEWDEVMALDENDDYVKVLMRVVNDETTGLETIQSKMLKNQ